MTKDFIELNGKRYDVETGALLLGQPARTPAKEPISGRTIDDFIRTPHTDITTPASPQAANIPHKPAAHAGGHQPERAKTLMRHAVKQPPASFKRHAKATTRTDALVSTPTIEIAPKHSVRTLDHSRLDRAKKQSRSKLISHFGGTTPSAPTPNNQPPSSLPPQEPIKTTLSTPRQRPTPLPHSSTDIFERAIAYANSHRQPPPPVPPSKGRQLRRVGLRLTASGMAMLLILILGFVAYQNMAQFQLHLVAMRSGVSATLPKWQPNGFSVTKFTYSRGNVTIDFKNQVHHFSLIETKSNWDSATLLDEFVSTRYSNYQAVMSGGQLIYIFEDGDATWVNSGIWYQLTNNDSLSTSSLVKLVESM